MTLQARASGASAQLCEQAHGISPPSKRTRSKKAAVEALAACKDAATEEASEEELGNASEKNEDGALEGAASGDEASERASPQKWELR